MTSIKFIGTIADPTGYGEACRTYIAAAMRAGIEVTSRAVTFEASVDMTRLGTLWDEVKPTIDADVDYEKVVICLTPDLYPKYLEPDKINIGMFYWETDVVPEQWVEALNELDELWLPCQYIAGAARKAGVTTPIRIIGTPFYDGEPPASDWSVRDKFSKDDYLFMAGFQWTHRKGPDVLFRAYFKTFQHREDPVVLVAKTYMGDSATERKERLEEKVAELRAETGSTARVHLIPGILTRSEILALHCDTDCFVSTHRSEGWSMWCMQAGWYGQPVIASNYGAVTEYLDEENSYLIPCKDVGVSGMPWVAWYQPHMVWGEPDVDAVASAMYQVFSPNHDGPGARVRATARLHAHTKAQRLKKLIRERYSMAAIGKLLKEAADV